MPGTDSHFLRFTPPDAERLRADIEVEQRKLREAEGQEAHGWFAEALRMARAHGWRKLEHFVLHHWGRRLAEEHRFTEARECFAQSLALREAMNDPRQESSRKALAALTDLEYKFAGKG